MMARLRWGLLSTARINDAVIPPLRASARGELAAVASRSPAKAEAYAAERDIPLAFGSYEDMLASDAVDVIYNSLPNGLHAEWTVKCLDAGKHVLLEKPFTITVAEAEAVIAAARRSGCVVAEAFMYRHHPQTLKVKEMVEAGAVGDVKLVKSAFTFNITREDDPRLDPAMGGGSLWDVGCYPISFAQYILGEKPVEVFGYQQTDPTGTDGLFVGQMRYASGRLAQIESAFRAPYRTQAEIVGSRGAISLNRTFRPDVGEGAHIHYYDGEHHQTIPIDGQMLYSGEVEDMHAAILDGTPPRVSLEESRNHVATIVALYESAAAGKPVRVA